jgi:hypothetical protein
VNELLARYSSLSGEDLKRDLTAQLMDGLRGGREEILHAIKEFERTGARDPDGGNFSAWLKKTLERYEAATRDQ